ncbi:type II toxin-antitoxin system toxin DNA ADP-ribosyl transferase DarT [Pseudomonas proteolytica]|uniref:type II toxin-antitoxin system toxin DNA ADP-ribosyl transferase DarT n=1 Tax=Pseudomonas proteolytica TaxID=219574 RepID=UPI0030D8F64A
MAYNRQQTLIYHITDISNLAGIVESGGLLSDAVMVGRGEHQVIGYGHIKRRRLEEIQVDCVNNRYVGEFVPFYYCPRSPMLFTINKGNTGRPEGCQSEIVHLVSTVSHGLALNSDWALSDGNAGAFHTSFYNDINELANLDWASIDTNSWGGKTHQKHSEFLVGDFYPWGAIQKIGCYNQAAVDRVNAVLGGAQTPQVCVERRWYY